MAQDLRQIGQTELTGSTGTVRIRRQTYAAAGIDRFGHCTNSLKGTAMGTAGLAFTTALIAGFLHALDVDHMVAVTTFVATRPTFATAIRFGAKWGIGHSLSVLLAGGILIATGLRWPAGWDTAGEVVVGALLVGVGLWAIRTTRKLHLHRAVEHGDHVHLHVHRAGEAHHHHSHVPGQGAVHRHGPGVVGFFHGLAGTTGAVALIPVTLAPSRWWSFGALLAFSAGVVLAMTLYAFVAAVAIRHTAVRSLAASRYLSQGMGGLGIGVGAWWIVRALSA